MSELDPLAAPHQASGSVEPERRAFVRLASDRPVTCSPAGRSRELGWPGRLQDISQGGFALLLEHRFRPGTAVAVDFRDGDGTSLRTIRASVVHAKAVLVDGCPCWLLGCAFDSPLGEDEFAALQ
jgi:PilZ domain